MRWMSTLLPSTKSRTSTTESEDAEWERHSPKKQQRNNSLNSLPRNSWTGISPASDAREWPLSPIKLHHTTPVHANVLVRHSWYSGLLSIVPFTCSLHWHIVPFCIIDNMEYCYTKILNSGKLCYIMANAAINQLILRENKERMMIKLRKSTRTGKKSVKFWFQLNFVLFLLLVIGVGGSYFSQYRTGFWWSILRIISSGCITASLIDIVLRFSSEQQYIENSTNIILDEIVAQHNSLVLATRMLRWKDTISNKSLVNAKMSREEIDEAVSGFSKNLNNYLNYCSNFSIFFHSFVREVHLGRGESAGHIRVETTTDLKIVNLSEDAYSYTINPQFRKGTISGDTFKILKMEVNDKDITASAQDTVSRGVLVPGYRSAEFVIGKDYSVEISAHAACHIIYTTSYQISLPMFFQAKCFSIPCRSFDLIATFEDDFPYDNHNYTFRWSLYRSKSYGPAGSDMDGESITYRDNSFLHIAKVEWMKPGNGYTLTVGEFPSVDASLSTPQAYSMSV